MTAKKKGRGGKRKGAGRPTIADDGETRVMFVTTTVASSTKAAFKAASKRLGKSVGMILDEIAQDLGKGRK